MCYFSSFKKIFFSFQDKDKSEVLLVTKVIVIAWEQLQITFVFKPVSKSLHQDICSIWGTTRSLQFFLNLSCIIFDGLYSLIIRTGDFNFNWRPPFFFFFFLVRNCTHTLSYRTAEVKGFVNEDFFSDIRHTYRRRHTHTQKMDFLEAEFSEMSRNLNHTNTSC